MQNESLTPYRIARCLFTIATIHRLMSDDAKDVARSTYVLLTVDVPPVMLARARDIVHGLTQLRWRRLLYEPLQLVAEILCILLDALGASFIKLSQVIAHSPMVAPALLVRACKASLARCRAPTVPFDLVESTLCDELRIPSVAHLFATIDTQPMASASIAQVHKATLIDGRSVVVKLVRPGVKERLWVDLTILWLAARAVDVLLGPLVLEFLSSPAAAFVDELRQAILAECDLGYEHANMLQYRQWLRSSVALRRSGLAGAVWVPEPIPTGCSASVLTMEWVDGVLLSDLRDDGGAAAATPAAATTSAAATSASRWKGALAKALSVSALSVLDGAMTDDGAGGYSTEGDGAVTPCFHADLHMGNMLYCAATDSVAFVDFGVCGRLPAALRGALLLQALSFVVEDTSHFSEGFAYALKTTLKTTRPARAEAATSTSTSTTNIAAVAAAAPATSVAEAENLPMSFEAATELVRNVRGLSTDAQLQLYGLYKQATSGDAPLTSPTSRIDVKEQKKWAAWAAMRGQSASTAQAGYLELAHTLLTHESRPDDTAPPPTTDALAPAPPPLDTAALTADLRQLFVELERINPLRPDSDGTIDPALYALLLRGQLVLHEHGVQLPKEFALLIKTMLFGADYLTLFRGAEMDLLTTALSAAAVAYVTSHVRELSHVIPRRALPQIGSVIVRSQSRRLRAQLVETREHAAKTVLGQRLALLAAQASERCRVAWSSEQCQSALTILEDGLAPLAAWARVALDSERRRSALSRLLTDGAKDMDLAAVIAACWPLVLLVALLVPMFLGGAMAGESTAATLVWIANESAAAGESANKISYNTVVVDGA